MLELNTILGFNPVTDYQALYMIVFGVIDMESEDSHGIFKNYDRCGDRSSISHKIKKPE